MKKTILAALLSAFVWPGAGHFLIGRRRRGQVFSVLGALLITFIMMVFAPIASRVISSIDPSTSISSATTAIETHMLEEVRLHGGAMFPAIIGLLILWLLALVDVLRLGMGGDSVRPYSFPALLKRDAVKRE